MNEQKGLYEELEKRVINLMENRTRVLNPCKLDPVGHVMTYSLSRREWAALKYLLSGETAREAFSYTFSVEVTLPLPHRLAWLRLDLPRRPDGRTDWPDIGVKFENLPEQVQNYIVRWYEYDRRLKDEENAVTQHFKRIGETVNTWGQLSTVWPTLIGLFPDKMKQRALNKRVKSKLGDYAYKSFDATTGKGVELEDFLKPEAIDQTQMLISEALLLPKHVEHITNQTPGTRYRTDDELSKK